MADAAPARRSRLLRWGAPAVAVAAGLAAAIAVAGRDGSEAGQGAPGAGTSRSSTIALGPSSATLWLTSPDDDQVVELDRSTLKVRRRLEVDGQPQELTVLGDRLLVTGAQRTSLAVLDLGADPPSSAAVDLPCGAPRSVVSAPSGTAGIPQDLAIVTCPNEDVLAVVDLDAGLTIAEVPLRGRPTGIVRSGEDLHVTTATDGRIHDLDLAALARGLPAAGAPTSGPDPAPIATVELLDGAGASAWADGERSASTLGAIDVTADGPVATYQIVDNVRKLSSKQLEGDATYGSPLNGRARLEPALAGPCGARFAEFGDEARLLSGPVALATSPDGDLVWVVGQFSQSVSVVRCDGGGPAGRSPTVASFDVGAGARGIALDPATDTATSTSASTTPSPPSGSPTTPSRSGRPTGSSGRSRPRSCVAT